MTPLDAALVRSWFLRLRHPNYPDQLALPHIGILPTEQEAAALAAGESAVLAAVSDEPRDHLDLVAAEFAEISEVPAILLLKYLQALAAGVASARRALTQALDPQDADAMMGADAGALALVAGLNAGAAALHGETSASVHLDESPERDLSVREPSVAESASQAGVAAAELVVNGAGLHEVAAAAADGAVSGWRVGLPTDPLEQVEYRARSLLALLLVALEIQTRAPDPPADPASCGAMPGQNLGLPFSAEITFAMGLEAADAQSLSTDLTSVATEVTAWPTSRWTRFHLHTDRPGEAIEQIYVYGTPFDLVITQRHDPAP